MSAHMPDPYAADRSTPVAPIRMPPSALKVRAEMARSGLAPYQLRPWDSPDEGYVIPLQTADGQESARRFLLWLWDAFPLPAPPGSSVTSVDQERET